MSGEKEKPETLSTNDTSRFGNSGFSIFRRLWPDFSNLDKNDSRPVFHIPSDWCELVFESDGIPECKTHKELLCEHGFLQCAITANKKIKKDASDDENNSFNYLSKYQQQTKLAYDKEKKRLNYPDDDFIHDMEKITINYNIQRTPWVSYNCKFCKWMVCEIDVNI
jgi:hypothetical protein